MYLMERISTPSNLRRRIFRFFEAFEQDTIFNSPHKKQLGAVDNADDGDVPVHRPVPDVVDTTFG